MLWYGADLPNALELIATYPFTDGAARDEQPAADKKFVLAIFTTVVIWFGFSNNRFDLKIAG